MRGVHITWPDNAHGFCILQQNTVSLVVELSFNKNQGSSFDLAAAHQSLAHVPAFVDYGNLASMRSSLSISSSSRGHSLDADLRAAAHFREILCVTVRCRDVAMDCPGIHPEWTAGNILAGGRFGLYQEQTPTREYIG
eukprot:scaffold1074_cov409-Prasinococcus_capsulatus_cf.AAC.24